MPTRRTAKSSTATRTASSTTSISLTACVSSTIRAIATRK